MSVIIKSEKEVPEQTETKKCDRCKAVGNLTEVYVGEEFIARLCDNCLAFALAGLNESNAKTE